MRTNILNFIRYLHTIEFNPTKEKELTTLLVIMFCLTLGCDRERHLFCFTSRKR